MPEDPIRRAFDLLDGPVQPDPVFFEALFDRLVEEAKHSRRFSPPRRLVPPRHLDEALGVRPPQPARSSRRRRHPALLVAAALVALVAVVAVVVVVPRPPSALAIVTEARARFSDLPPLRASVVKFMPGSVLAEEVGQPVPDWTLITEVSYQDEFTWRREIVGDEHDPFVSQGQVGSYQVSTPQEQLIYDASSGTASVEPSGSREPAQARLEALREMSPSLDQAAPVTDEAIRSCEVLADDRVAGRDAHHLRCTFDDGGRVTPGAEAWLDVETGVLLKLTFPNGLRFEVTEIEYGASFPPEAFSTELPVSPGHSPGGSGGSSFDTGLSLGDEVPTWTLPLVGGDSLDLASLHGRWAVVYVWATWCGATCSGGRAEDDPLRAVDEAFAQHGAEIGVVALAPFDYMAAVADVAERARYTVPMAVAKEPPADLWGGFGVPSLVVIDPDGDLAGAYIGDLQGDDIRRIVTAVVNADPLPDVGGQTKTQLPA